jgi:hypothetical protein
MGVRPRRLVRGVWEVLFTHALQLIDEISAHSGPDPFWTFGGGTVLMLRYRHRRSRDIDLFVPDPQYLGFVTPRLSSLAEAISDHYVESADHVKLILADGEIDFVAAPNLTAPAFESWQIKRRAVRVETAVEIVAKKMWYRGDAVTARDLFDLSLVIERERSALHSAARFLTRHRSAFVSQLRGRERVLREQFHEIDALDYRPTYDECVRRVEHFLGSLPARSA